jgi:hypothetical protein
MSPELVKALDEMSVNDRCSMLISSITATDRDCAIGAVLGVLSAAYVMATRLDEPAKWHIAKKMHHTAERIAQVVGDDGVGLQ